MKKQYTGLKKFLAILTLILIYMTSFVLFVAFAPFFTVLRLVLGVDLMKDVEEFMMDIAYVLKKNILGKK